jgi:hypothetical protein
MEFRLSRSPFSRFFLSQWNFDYHKALSHKLFSRWNTGFQGASHTDFFFHDGILAIKEPFTRSFLFHDGIHKIHDLGEVSFHTYITKSIYIGSSSLKTLPLDLELPLQGKEYGPSYYNAATKKES